MLDQFGIKVCDVQITKTSQMIVLLLNENTTVSDMLNNHPNIQQTEETLIEKRP